MNAMGSPSNLLEVLERHAVERLDRTAYHFEGAPHSFGELWHEAGRFATALRARGLERGDRVVLAIPNGPDFFTVFYGIQRAGGVPVPAFPRSGARRLERLAARCTASLVVIASSEVGDRTVEEQTPAGIDLFVAGTPLPDAIDPTLPEVRPEELAYLQYTSGSTGEPKGVEVRHAALLTNIRQMIAGMEITASDVFVSWLPVHHDMGLVLMTMVPLYLGAPLYLLPTRLRSPGNWLAEIERRRGTFTAAPDFAYRLCLHRGTASRSYDLSSLRVALNAAEPVRKTTLEEFAGRFGVPGVMRPAYGLAEATVGVSMCRLGSEVRVDDRGFVSVGYPFPDIEIALLASEQLVEAGEIGEILVKSPANTTGYWSDPEASRELFWGAGYLRTGDLGYLAADGELYVVGRTKNLIIQGGRNIAPKEVEEAVDSLPFVRSSAAVGIDRGGDEGEQVYLFVELRKSSATGAFAEMTVQLVEAVHAHLGLRPGRVYLMPARGLPRTPNGKIRYPELRGRYLDGDLRDAGLLLFPSY